LAAGSAPPASAAPATAPPTAGTVAPATAAPAATAADDTTASAETGSTEPASTEAAECVGQIPEETAGPFPGDGTNGANVLTEDGVVRSDITSSFGSSTTTADGVPLGLVLTVQDAASCTPLAGAAVYAWHCDAAGDYSLYSDGVTGENYLRGVQETDANGQVRFTSIFPGCYSGRWPHVHFEIYDSLSSATSGANSIATSQLAFPQDACESVYADARYPQSVSNLAQLSLATDNVFADDGGMHQLATMTGSDAGYTASLTIGV
jgi:protocatechuate 3,4-dioxygenase beta subunit